MGGFPASRGKSKEKKVEQKAKKSDSTLRETAPIRNARRCHKEKVTSLRKKQHRICTPETQTTYGRVLGSKVAATYPPEMRSLCDSSEHMCSKWLGTCSWVPQQSAQVFGRATQACAKVFYLLITDSRFSNSCTSAALVWRSSSVVWSALSPECKWHMLFIA